MFDILSAALAGNLTRRRIVESHETGFGQSKMYQRRKAVDVMGIFAATCVSDMERSVAWYAKLMGRAPEDRPMPTLAQWRYPGAGGVQLFLDAPRAGNGVMTIVTPLMASARAGLEAAGIALGPDNAGDWGIVAQVHDPDGNRITLAEPPKGFAG